MQDCYLVKEPARRKNSHVTVIANLQKESKKVKTAVIKRRRKKNVHKHLSFPFSKYSSQHHCLNLFHAVIHATKVSWIGTVIIHWIKSTRSVLSKHDTSIPSELDWWRSTLAHLREYRYSYWHRDLTCKRKLHLKVILQAPKVNKLR